MKFNFPQFLSLLLVSCLISSLDAQITGGQTVFSFLKTAPSARITALGGSLVTVQDDDVSLATFNPAALNPAMHNKLSFQHQFYLSDIQTGAFSYGRHLDKYKTTVHATAQYIGYGDIAKTDEFGNVLGELNNTEWAITAGAGRQLSDRFTLGLNLRFAGSYFDTYSSTAIGADASLMYVDTAKNFTAALVLKNAATQLSTYNGVQEDMPFDVQLGVSKRLKYLPFRLSVIAHHLQEWNIRFDDPNLEQETLFLFGEENADTGSNPDVDIFFRHLIFNGEFLLGSNEAFKLRIGYNHLRKKEMSVNNYRSLAGFSGGFGFGVKRLRFDVGYAAYHLAGGGFHLGLSTTI